MAGLTARKPVIRNARNPQIWTDQKIALSMRLFDLDWRLSWTKLAISAVESAGYAQVTKRFEALLEESRLVRACKSNE